MHARATRQALLRSTPLLLLLGLSGALLASAAGAQVPQATPASADATLLTVSASAEARRVPDVATMSAGVVTRAADARTAMQANATQMAAVVDTLRGAGIAERDIRTSGVSLHPQYRHDGDEPAITGYQVSNTVEVTVRDVARVGPTLDALVASGANQVHGPSFSIDRPGEAMDEARRAALDKARERAGMYAQSLGLQVRRIVHISEGGGMGPVVPMAAAARMEMAAKDTSISPGENVVTANLEVVFELGR